MPTISLTVEVPWPKGKVTLSKLERAIHRAAMSAGRQALVQALRAWEAELLPAAGARQRRVRRYLLTRLGPVRFWRWKTKKDGSYGFPLDRAIGVAAWQSCSPLVWERACRLAASFPYRQAARLLSDLVGQATDHRVLWRLVQKAGRARRAAIEHQRAAVFEMGEVPPEPDEPPEMVVTEIDGAVLRHCRGGVFEAKVAAAYRGKHVISTTARHPKRVVTGKTAIAGVYEEGTAGQVFYATLCRSVGLHRARHRMVSGDGAEWIPVLVREWFPDHVFQLDHYHLKQRLRQAAGDPDRAGRWIAWALSGSWPRIERSMAQLVAGGRLDPKVARDPLLPAAQRPGDLGVSSPARAGSPAGAVHPGLGRDRAHDRPARRPADETSGDAMVQRRSPQRPRAAGDPGRPCRLARLVEGGDRLIDTRA